MRPLFLFLFCLFLVTSSYAQEEGRSAEVDELFKLEAARAATAKSGNKSPVVVVVSDPQKVALIRATMEKNAALKQKQAAAKLATGALWTRYKQKDKSVVPELMAILKGSDKTKRAEVFRGLEKTYRDPADYAITEPELIAQIFQAVNNVEDEKPAVQLAVFNKLPGYEAVFERRLVSGESVDDAKLFFWLGESKSIASLDYMEKRLKERPMNREQQKWMMNGLRDFGSSGDTGIKNRVTEICLYIYNHVISSERIDSLKNSRYSSDAAEILLTCLFEYGDKRVLPVAENIFKRKIRFVGPIKAMIRLDGPQHIEKMNELLKDEKGLAEAVRIIETVDRKYIPDQILKDVLLGFTLQATINYYQIDKFIPTYKEIGADNVLRETIPAISNKIIRDRLQKVYDLANFDRQKIIDDLVASGIIGKKPADAEINEVMKRHFPRASLFVYALLHNQKIAYHFDAETGFVPADYDVLLKTFAENSQGLLKDMKVWMDARTDKADSYKYTVTALAGNKAFIIQPEDNGDWYDVVLVSKLLDDILRHLSSSKRFVSVETNDQTACFIFGEPAKVQPLVKKYSL